MSTVEDILSNPSSSTFYLNHRYYYAIGNTRSVDLTEGCEVPSSSDFLLLGCGDIRNILQTVQEVSDIKPAPKSLTFNLNDIDDVLLARNTLLIHIANMIDPDNIDDVKFLWSVWYNLDLSEDHFQRYRAVLSELMENPQNELQYQSSECSNAVEAVLRYWRKKQIPLDEIRAAREQFMCKKMEAQTKSSTTFQEVVKNHQFNIGSMYHFPGSSKKLSNSRSDEVKRYFESNTTDAACVGYTNTSFLCPHVDGWRVHPGSLPFYAYNDLLFDETSSLTENCLQQLQAQLRCWKKLKNVGAKVKIVVWYGDALALCHRMMPPSMKFDFINSSNLCDHITLLNVLLACSKRLKRRGILTTQTMHMLEKAYSTMDEYLDAETGIPTGFYPTFLGLRLAENFELGTSKVPKLMPGFTEVTMRWLAAGKCSPCVDIDDSSELTRIFEDVAKLCFESCMLRKGCKWPNTPLALVFLMKELATKLASGVMPLLRIAERNLPKSRTTSGIEFCPLATEWKVLTLYHFTDQLDLPEDTLVAVKVPLKLDWSKMTFHSPAGLDGIFGAIITEGLGNMMSFIAKGESIMPWSCLSVASFDYETCVMTCILPKSDMRTYGVDTLIWPLQAVGAISPLLPTGIVNTNGPTIDIQNSTHFNNTKKTQGSDSSEIQLTVCETENTFRVSAVPKDKAKALEKIEIQVDQEEQLPVIVGCLTRDGNGSYTSQLRTKLPCKVRNPETKVYRKTNTVKLDKDQSALTGPMILPWRRMNLTSHPLFLPKKLNKLINFLGGMFSSHEDSLNKAKGTESESTLFKLKETIQFILLWSLQPPSGKPLVRSYRILREYGEKRPTKFQFGYFPDDIFIGAQKLHNVNGIPTLVVVWMDFEIFRKQVPYEYGIETLEGETFLFEHGGSARTPETCHSFFVSPEEAVLLKQLLRLNTRRTKQTVNGCGNPQCCFNSFIQPSYTVVAEKDHHENLQKFLAPGGHEMCSELQNMWANNTTKRGGLSVCSYCGKESGDMKRCQACKSTLYCSKDCQRNDWKLKHRGICRLLTERKKGAQDKDPDEQTKAENREQPEIVHEGIKGLQATLPDVGQELTSGSTPAKRSLGETKPLAMTSQSDKTNRIQRCGYCDNIAKNMQKCSRCKAIFYCSKTCQSLDWNHKHRKICRPVD